MRKISHSLVITIAALWACSVHATPDQAGHRFEKHPSDAGLLTQISQAGQSVSLKASELVAGAMGFIGVPYQRGGSSADTGFDCSGFVRSVYQQSIGLLLPRKAEEQASATQHISKNELRPGDLVFFNTMRRAFSHVGIYVGNGKFIHSPKPGSEVRIDNMALDYWENRFDGARRVPAVAFSQPHLATSLAALNDDTGPGAGLSIGTYTGTGAGTNASANLGADSSAAPRASGKASTRAGTHAGVGSGERSAKTLKLKPAQAKKLEAKKSGLKKDTTKKQASKKQEAKKQDTRKQDTGKRESTKHASAPGAAKTAKTAKTAKAAKAATAKKRAKA